MKILNAKVYEFPPGVLNKPTLQILVDKVLRFDDFVYRSKQVRDGTAYFAEKDGDVSFIFHQPTNQTGYGGYTFTVPLDTGETIKVKGPWSSRPSQMMPLFDVDCMNVSVTDDPESFNRGHTFMAGHITVDLARTALPFIPGWTIVKEETSYGEMNWEMRKVEA